MTIDDQQTLPRIVAYAKAKREQEAALRPAGRAPLRPAKGVPGEHPYALAALRRSCAEIAAMAPNTGRDSALNAAVFFMAGYVAGGHLTEATLIRELAEAGRACRLPEHQIRTALRHGNDKGAENGGLARGLQTPRHPPEMEHPPLSEFRGADQDADPAPPTEDDAFEAELIRRRRIDEEADKLRIREAARRIVTREGRGPNSQPLAPTTLADFLEIPDDPQRYRIEGLLPVGGRVVLAAQYKAGKSTMVGNLARCMADNKPFLDRFAVHPPPGRTVIIDAELDERMLRSRLRDQGITVPGRVAVVALRGRVAAFDILDDEIRAEWAKQLHDAHCDFLVVDCLRPILDSLGLDENRDAGRFLVHLDELLLEAGIGEAVLVHHAGHSGERSRGDSRLRDWPDAEWRLVREVAEDGQSDPNARRYFSAFGRDVDQPEGLLTYDPQARWMTLAGGSRRDTASDTVIVDLVDLLAREPGLSGRKIEAAMTGLYGRDKVRAAIKRGIQTGQIDITYGAKNSSLHFAATPSVRECADSAR